MSGELQIISPSFNRRGTEAGLSTISDAIQLQATLQPDLPAIVCAGLLAFSFRELNTKIRQIGDELRAAGIGASSRVGVVLPFGPEAAVIAVAVSAHAIGFPLNPALSSTEFEFELKRADLDAVVLPGWIELPAAAPARAHSIGVFRASRAIHSLTEIDLEPVAKVPSVRQRSGVPSSRSVSVIQMSSGSTGAPKLILITHANLFDIAGKMRTWFGLSASDRCACILPIYSGFGFKIALVAPLLIGGSIILPKKQKPEDVAAWTSDLHPTWFVATPTYLHAALDKLRSGPGGKLVHSLRFFASTSAYLPEAVRTGLETILGIPGLEFYGLREAGIVAANPAPPAKRKPGSVGLISPDVAILNDDGDILPRGTAGAVAVRGQGVTPGYIEALPSGSDSLSQSNLSQNKWSLTGDLGIVDADGFLSIVGRKKDIINRGGEKIAPSEIEKALLLHPAVREAVAFGVPHPRLGENVSAAVVLKPETEATSSEFQEFLTEHLASFKVPQRVYLVRTLPRTGNGKVRTSELREYFSNRVRQIAPPEGDLEVLIVEIWERVLGRTDIGVDENFFELGGDSLLAAEMIVEVETLIRRQIPRSALRAVMTVRQLAAAALRVSTTKNDLITCAKTGSGAPFFFCHGDDHNRGIYALRLANMIEKGFPIFLLNPFQEDYRETVQVTMEDMARRYVPQLLTAQPTGQFRIGGFCVGGLLAWEIAAQLVKAGRDVEFFVLIDAPSLNGRFAFSATKKLLSLIAQASPAAIRKKIDLDSMVFVWAWARRIMGNRPIAWRVINRFFGNNSENRPSLSVLPHVREPQWMEHYRRMANYLPQHIDTELFHLVCNENARRPDFSPLAWINLARVFHSKVIPGEHTTCITTFADKLATELERIFSARDLDSIRS